MKSRVNPFGLRRELLSTVSGLPGSGSDVRPRLRALRALPLLPLLAACGEDHLKRYPQTTFAPATEYARDLDWLFDLTLYLGVAVGIFVFALLAYIIVRFRYRPGNPEPQQIHGNTRLELLWTFIPALILAGIAIPTVQMIFATQREAPANALIVDVKGWQWWWEFRYVIGNDTVVTANEIHVPVGTPVQLRMEAGDVLHSFWVPQMGGKRDLIPGRINTILFTPEEPGVYLGQCAEFCGDSHALMKMRLIAHDPADFQAWFRNEGAPAVQPTDTAVKVGKQLFTQVGCGGCHVIEGHEGAIGKVGPSLTHIGRRRTIAAGILENNAENLNAWINRPTEIKPGAKMINAGWTPEQVEYIVAYLQTLQ